MHIYQAIKGEKKDKTESVISDWVTFPATCPEIFFIGRRTNVGRHVPLYTSLKKARIWLKLSPSIFFKLFARKRFTLVFLPYI